MTSLPPSLAPNDASLPWWQRRAAWLYAAVDEEVLGDYSDPGKLEDERPLVVETVGTLTFPGGRLVVGDPYWVNLPEPVVQVLPDTPYDVTLVRALVGPDHERNAAAVLHAGTAPVVAWEMARRPGQDVATLGPGELYGYGVDSGTGCFAGVDGAAALARMMDEGGPEEYPLFEAMSEGEALHAFGPPMPGEPAVAVFTSGWGDGEYPTWLGRDAGGDVVVAVTDFLLTNDPYLGRDEPEPPPPAAPRAGRPSLWSRLLGR